MIHERQCEKCSKGEHCGLREMYARMIVDRHYREDDCTVLTVMNLLALGGIIHLLGEKLGVW